MFIFRPHSALENADLGDWHDETAAPLTNELQLLHDFIFQVPRQDNHVVGPRFTNVIRMKDRYVSSGKHPALFVRTAVHRELDEVLADATIVEERGTFSRCTVARHQFALLRGGEEEIERGELRFLHLPRKSFVGSDGIESGFPFEPKQCFYAWLDGMS